MGGKVFRGLAVLALVTTIGVTSADAAPRPEGDATSANISVDVIVVGTPPPGETIVVDTPGSDPEQTTFALAGAAGTNDVFAVSTFIYRNVFLSDTGGASSVVFDCEMVTDNPENTSSCSGAVSDEHLGGPHADIFFQPTANRTAYVTVTLTFGRCDGRAITGTTATAGNDVLLGTSGPDTINGLGGHDRICGGAGNDRITGGAGNDRLIGGTGHDRLLGGDQRDALFGSAGNDTIQGNGGVDALDGGANYDDCNGGLLRDTGVRCERSAGIP
jgi:Ca2+-binding RTX toxin-like protein